MHTQSLPVRVTAKLVLDVAEMYGYITWNTEGGVTNLVEGCDMTVSREAIQELQHRGMLP